MVFVKTKSVQIQVKSMENGLAKSKSFTVYDTDIHEVYNRIAFLFEQISSNRDKEEIKMVHRI